MLTRAPPIGSSVHGGTKGSNPPPSSGESANSRSLCSADLKAMCEASASRLSVPRSPSATQKRVERCSLGRSLALPRTARHIVGRALDIRLESKLSDAMTTARFPARPAEIFNGRNRRGSLRKINPCGYRHDRAALGNLRNMTTARQRRLWPPAPCPAPPSPSPAVDARPRRRVSPPRSCFLLTWPSPQPTAVSWRVFRTSPNGYTRSSV